MNVSIIMPMRDPKKKIIKEIETAINNQDFKGKIEIIKMLHGKGLADKLNKGIKKSKDDTVVTLHSDCLPKGKKWLHNLVQPLKEEEEVVATVSRVHLPESVWESIDVFAKGMALRERGTITPLMDDKACAFKKSVLNKLGGFDSKHFRTGGEDYDIAIKLKKQGKIVYPDSEVDHFHPTNLFDRLEKLYQISDGWGALVRVHKKEMIGWYKGLLMALPIFGIAGWIANYPLKKGFRWFFPYLLITPVIHTTFVLGFWRGFLNKKQTV